MIGHICRLCCIVKTGKDDDVADWLHARSIQAFHWRLPTVTAIHILGQFDVYIYIHRYVYTCMHVRLHVGYSIHETEPIR